MLVRNLVIFGASALLASGMAYAHQYKACAIEVQHPWARASAPHQETGAGYMIIKNTGTTDDRLVSVSTDAAAMAEVHQVTTENNMTKMGPVDGLTLPHGQTVELAPNGYHVMFMNIKGPFKEGTKIPATLTFEKAGQVKVDFSVEPINYKPDHDHSMHMDMTQQKR